MQFTLKIYSAPSDECMQNQGFHFQNGMGRSNYHLPSCTLLKPPPPFHSYGEAWDPPPIEGHGALGVRNSTLDPLKTVTPSFALTALSLCWLLEGCWTSWWNKMRRLLSWQQTHCCSFSLLCMFLLGLSLKGWCSSAPLLDLRNSLCALIKEAIVHSLKFVWWNFLMLEPFLWLLQLVSHIGTGTIDCKPIFFEGSTLIFWF